MISKEKYSLYVTRLIKRDKNKRNVESLSLKYKFVWISLLIIGIIFFVFFAFGFVITLNKKSAIMAVISMVLFNISIIKLKYRSKTLRYYKENYREKIINYLLKDTKHYFYEFGEIDSSTFDESQFSKGSYNRYYGKDYLVVNIPNDDNSRSNVDLRICDLNVYDETRDEEGNTSRHTCYKGMFGCVEFNSCFKCILSVDSSYKKKGVKLEKVKLEDIVFGEKFKIKASDQIEARYILTPKMMGNLLHLEEKFNNLKIVLSGNKLYFGAPKVNLFELEDYNGDEVAIFDNLYDEIKTILAIVEELKNNNKVFNV